MTAHHNSHGEQPLDISRVPVETEGSGLAPAVEPVVPAAATPMNSTQWKGGAIDYVMLARRYWLWLACGLVGGLLVGHTIYKRLGPEFDATSKILVSKQIAVPIEDEREAQTFGERAEHIALIMSPIIVEKAVELHKLDELPTLAQSNDPVEDVLDGLKVQRSAGDDRSMMNVLDITFKSKSRDDAKTVVNAVIDAYDHFLAEQHQEKTAQLQNYIDKANVDLKRQIDDAEEDYADFRKDAPVYVRTPQRGPNGETISVSSNVHEVNLDALLAEQEKLASKRTEASSKIRAIEDELAAGTPREEIAAMIQMFTAPQSKPTQQNAALSGLGAARPGFDSRLISLRLRERELTEGQGFGDGWWEVVAVRAQIQEIHDIYRESGVPLPKPGQPGNSPRNGQPAPVQFASGRDIVDIYLLSLEAELKSITDQQKQNQIAFNRESKAARELSVYLEQDRKLNDRIDRVNGLWSSIEVQAAKLDIEKQTPGYTLRQIAPARDQLSFKRIVKLYGVGVFGVLGLIGGLIFLREWRDTTLKTVDEIRQSLPLPILGAVPAFVSKDRNKVDSPLVDSLCYYHRPGSPEAEAYRSVRTAFNVCVNREQSVIQVTSPEPGDGKSTLIANLAIAIAQSGRRVLLIDSDLRKPMMHQLFGLPQDIGVTDVLAGEIDLVTAAQSTVVDGLSVLTSGGLPTSPAELLASPGYGTMMHAAQQEFDIVLVDTPPLLAVSDPCIVAQRTHGMILVLRLQKNTRSAARRASELLQTNHVNVVGVVANDINDLLEGYDYRNTYGGYLKSGGRAPDEGGVSTERSDTEPAREEESFAAV